MNSGAQARQTQVASGMEILEKNIAELTEKTLRLEERLSKVMLTAKPIGSKSPDPTGSEEFCPLAADLRGFCKSISNVIDSIDDMLKRIEL